MALGRQKPPNYRCYPKLVGETGGKDFVFAHPSAAVEPLVTALVRGAFEFQDRNARQLRAYIPGSLWPEVKKRLVEEVNTIKMGDVRISQTSWAQSLTPTPISRSNLYRLRQAIERRRNYLWWRLR